jgi:hypothetical protein
MLSRMVAIRTVFQGSDGCLAVGILFWEGDASDPKPLDTSRYLFDLTLRRVSFWSRSIHGAHRNGSDHRFAVVAG